MKFKSVLRSGAILSLCSMTHTALAVDDPLKGYHNISPHDDVLYNGSYFNSTGESLQTLTDFTSSIQSYKLDGNSTAPTQNIVGGEIGLVQSTTGNEAIPARLFAITKDSKVVLNPNSDLKTASVYIYNDDTLVTSAMLPALTDMPVTLNYNAVKADFNHDGIEEVIAIGDDVVFNDSSPLVNVDYNINFSLIKAKEAADVNQGIEVSTLYSTSGSGRGDDVAIQYNNAVVGDLTGDSNQEIAYASKNNIKIFTVCSGDESTLTGSVCAGQAAYTVIPRSSLPYTQGSFNTASASFNLSIGDYHGQGNELAILSNTQPASGGDWSAEIQSYQFDIDAKASLSASKDITDDIQGGYNSRGGYCFAVTAKKNPLDADDQLWAGCSNYLATEDKEDVGPIMTLFQAVFNTSSQTIDIASSQNWNTGYWRIRGLAKVYSGTIPDSAEPSDLNYSLAFAMKSSWVNSQFKIKMYSLSTSSGSDIFPDSGNWEYEFDYADDIYRMVIYKPYKLSTQRIHPEVENKRTKNLLYPADFTGTSMRLGSPLYYKSEEIEKPFLVLGTPPSHIDYLTPETEGAPTVLNMSVGAELYAAEFENSSTGSVSMEKKDVSTLTTTVATDIESEFSLFGAEGIKTSIGGEYTNEQTVNNINETSGSVKQSIEESAGFQDKIGIETVTTEYYLYPILGRYACPSDDTCTDEEKVQQYVQLTIPTTQNRLYIDADLVPWYQTVHEPNNVLSYPRNIDQVETDYGSSIQLLSDSTNSFVTGSDGGKWEITWENGSSTSTETETLNTGAWNMSMSGSFGLDNIFAPILDFKSTVSIKYSGESSNNNTVINSSQYDAGMSLTITRPSTFTNPPYYNYEVTPVIFGDAQGDMDLSSDVLTPKVVADAVGSKNPLAMGIMKLGYWVDTQALTSGTWWKGSPEYTVPNLALNNPTRWEDDLPRTPLNDEDTNCLGPFSDGACYLPNKVDSTGREYISSFYNMRGLFITPKGSDVTRYEAQEGETMTLQARIYNYSLQDMAADSTVHVQFYRQSKDDTSIELTPDSAILIGETTLNPIAGAQDDAANWAMAAVDWDTTGLTGNYYFWVLVWGENSDGSLMEESPNKGLAMTTPPSSYTDISQVPLSIVTLENGQDYSFTDNVGMYPQEFAVVAQEATQAGLGVMSAEVLASPNQTVSITEFHGRERKRLNGQRVHMTVGLTSSIFTRGSLLYLVTNANTDDEKVVAISRRPSKVAAQTHRHLMSFKADQCGDIPVTLYVGGLHDNALTQKTTHVFVQCH